jgi:hypothetical protein
VASSCASYRYLLRLARHLKNRPSFLALHGIVNSVDVGVDIDHLEVPALFLVTHGVVVQVRLPKLPNCCHIVLLIMACFIDIDVLDEIAHIFVM